MDFSLLRSQRGWVSLPIIALLLMVATVSVHYQERVQASYQWRGQLNEVEVNQQIWKDFQQTWIVSPNFTSAKASSCFGFCELKNNSLESTWYNKEGLSLVYRWESYQSLPDESDHSQVFHRLCATQNQQQYRCWWWREKRQVSSGWVSASD